MLNWKGSFRYGAGVYKLALGLVAQGKIELEPLITHRYKFNQAKEAFQCMAENKGYDGKPPIKCESLYNPLFSHIWPMHGCIDACTGI